MEPYSSDPNGFGAGYPMQNTYDSETSYYSIRPVPDARGAETDYHTAPYYSPGYDHGADIGDPQQAPRRSTFSPPFLSPTPTYKNGDYGMLPGSSFSSTFDIEDNDKKSLLTTAKVHHPHQARKFLFKAGFSRFFITFALCTLIALILKGYEGFKDPIIITNRGVRVFNALMLGLSLALGLNLASSLKRYVAILRWSFLSRRYVSLEVFDLILGVETLTNVGKLMVISIPGIHRFPLLRRLPWFREARKDSSKWTWLLCLFWLLVNIGAQVLVASLSLFWPVDPSDAIPLLAYGNVSVSDLTKWKIEEPDVTWNNSAMEAAWSYGTEASAYPVFNVSEMQRDLSSLAGTPLYVGDGFYEYRFLNRNPDHLYTNYLVSSRKVQARASCVQLETQGEYVDDTPMYVVGRVPGGEWEHHKLPEVTVGSISWIGAIQAHCGPRCTNFTVFQDSDNEDIKHNSLFLCNSTLSDVTGGEKDFTNLRPEDRAALYGTDEFARIATGTIAWTGTVFNGWTDRSTRSYLRGSKWSPYKIITKEEVEDLLSRFTIGAIAAFDDHGIRYQVRDQWTRPVQGQQLKVDWPWVLALLGGICVLQLAGLMALLVFANKTIIRDASYFSMAMLLRPVVNRIGREGMNMTGEEIKRHPKLMFKRIRYDYREGKDGEPNQVDIFFEGKDMKESRKSWTPGLYS